MRPMAVQNEAGVPAALLLRAIEDLDGPIYIFDAAYRLLYANAAARAAWPKFVDAAFAGADLMSAISAQTPSLFPNRTPDEIERITQKSYALHFSGAPAELRAANGRIIQMAYAKLDGVGYVGVGVDVTNLRDRDRELMAARRAAEDANQAKSDFLAMMSHEIRTPLNGILGMARSMSEDAAAKPYKDRIKTILDCGEVLLTLLNDILDLSKIEARKLELSPVLCDIGDVTERACDLWRAQTEDKGLNFKVVIDPGTPQWVMLDTVRYRQSIANLLSNAIKFTASGEVSLELSPCRSPRNAVNDDPLGASCPLELVVTDTGTGIDEATQQRLFRPFSQADASTTRRFGGTGLGLSITKKLAQLMHGDLTLESRPGRGSTFRFRFHAPAAPVAQCENGPTENDGGQLSLDEKLAPGVRILVVDDNDVNRQVIAVLLKGHDVSIAQAASGASALEYLAHHPIDLVLLDISMPDMDGVELFRRIRASNTPWRETPVIAVTANASEHDRDAYLGLGMNGYVSKPVDRRALTAEIVRALGTAIAVA